MPRKDFSQIALDVVRQATREEPKPAPKPKDAPKPKKQTAPKGTKGAVKKPAKPRSR